MRVSLPIEHAQAVAAPVRFLRHERAPGRPAELEHEVGRDGRLANAPANAVGSEESALHGRQIMHCNARVRGRRVDGAPDASASTRLAHVVDAHDRRAALDGGQRRARCCPPSCRRRRGP
jgi:hypothetical protein